MKPRKSRKSVIEKYEKEELMLSLERTVLSKERTVLTEITVLLGFITLGVAIIKFFESSPQSEILVFGYCLVAFATLAVFYSILNYKNYTKELKRLDDKNHDIKID